MGRDREGAREHHPGDLLVFQLRRRPDAVHLCDLPDGPGFHHRPGLRPLHLRAQYPLHPQRQARRRPRRRSRI